MVKEKVEVLSSSFFIREYVPVTSKMVTPDFTLEAIKLELPATST